MSCRSHLWLGIVLLGGSWTGWMMAEEPQDARSVPILSGCEYDYAPFCVVRDDGQADGFSVQLLRAALEAVGRKAKFKTAPWAEIKQDLAEGRLQALPMVARTPEREESFDFTFPYYTMHGTIVVREDNIDIHGPADLKGKRVAVLQEDIAHEYLRDADLGAVIVPLPSFATAMRELSEGQHDAVVIQKLLAFQIMKETGLANLQTVGPPLTGYRQVFCFAVRRGDTELLSLLNEGLSIVMADDTFRRLHVEWFSSLEALGRTKSRIIVGGDVNYPPYEFLDSNGQPAGYNVELTRAIARQMDLSVDIRLAPWAEIRAGLAPGDVDMVHGMFYSAERDKHFDFSPPHALIQHVIIVRKGSPPVSDMHALVGKSILVMTGDIMHDWAIQHGYEPRVVLVNSQEEALRRLAAGEQDCALVARVPALYWIEKNRWSNLAVAGQPLLSAEYCYAVPQGKESLLSEFAEGLAAVKATGEYRAIQTKWLAPYEETRVGVRTILKYVLLSSLPLFALLAGAIFWTRSLQAQVRRRTRELQTETEFLHLISAAKTTREVVHAAAEFLQKLSGCEAIGVRLQDGDDYPFYETRGYPSEFVQKESHLCAWDARGTILHESSGQAVRECMCGNVIEGRFDPSKPFFTRGGSFWSNSITELLAGTTTADWQTRMRSGCHVAGYESMAIVPLRMAEQRLGLVQFHQRRPGMFTAEGMTLWERLAGALAVAIAKARAEEALRHSEERFRLLVEQAVDGIFVSDRQGRYLDVNSAGCHMLGYSREEILRRTIADLLAVEEVPRLAPEVARFADGQVVRSEWRFRRRDGSFFIGEVVGRQLPDGRHQAILRDITERKQVEEALKASEQRLRWVLQGSGGGAWDWDLTMDEAWWSQEMYELWGVATGTRMRLDNTLALVYEQDRDHLRRAVEASLAGHANFECEFRIQHPLHGERWMASHGRSVQDVSGRPVRLLGIVLDITHRKRAEEELAAARQSAEQAKATAEQANRAKDHFLAVLSHELRTPLTPVLMGVSMLQDRPDLDPNIRETLEMIRHNVEMEARLIDDLLDVTRIARGKIELHRGPVELGTVIQRAIEVCKPDIEARGLHFGVDMGPAASYWIDADASRLQQVFWNLLKNAIKFTPHGGCVGIRCRPEAAHVVIEVNDSGIGLELEALSRIFNAFEQAERSITRQFGGLGLGLAISKALVEMHGGTIEAQSEGRDKGTTFRVRLALAAPARQSDVPTPPAAPPCAVRPLHILLVEDHGVTAKMMRMVLSLEGHTVETAGDVATALELAGRHAFDLLLSDLGLPDGSGHDLIRALRVRGHRFPGIALSGYGHEDDIRRSCEAGFAAHLTKPASREALLGAVAAVTVGTLT